MEQPAWTVECLPLENGIFLLFHNGMLHQAQALKHLLFGWHAPSFYGTLLPIERQDRVEGIRVTAAEMLEVVELTPAVRWVELKRGNRFRIACETAKLYTSVLKEGRYKPSFEKWKAGAFGWDLLLDEVEREQWAELYHEATQLGHPKLVDWFDTLMSELLTQNEAREDLRLMALRSRPELGDFQRPSPHGGWASEQDWLEMIRWAKDETPFRILLWLVEPEQERSPWRLQVHLQDKQNPDYQVACVWNPVKEIGSSSCGVTPVSGEFPAQWMPFLQSRVRQYMENMLHILPWLKMKLSEEEAWRFLAQGSLLLTEAGFHVIVPVWWQKVRQMKSQLKASISSSTGVFSATTIGWNQLIQFDWKLAVGDVNLTEAEFRQWIEEDRRLIRLHDRWIQLNPEDVKAIRQWMKKIDTRGMTLGEVLKYDMVMERQRMEHDLLNAAYQRPDNELQLELELNDQLQHWLVALQHHESIPPCDIPEGLNGTLRKYQVEGYSWMMFLRHFGLGACLADDMGLGKTIQWIAYVLRVREVDPQAGPSLLICPTSLVGNWQKELKRFAPDMQVYLHYGADRIRDVCLVEAIQGADVFITTYTLALADREWLWPVMWNSLCLDEAQNIKNPYTKQSVAIRKLQARHRIALTGTPMENNLTELWSIFDFINPGYLGTLAQFRKTYVHPIEHERDAEWTKLVQRLVQPFLLRRLKRDPEILPDLPDKNESKVYVTLTVEQASVYERTLQALFDDMDRLNTMERRGRVLTVLTKLKQICNHPSLVQREWGLRREAAQSGKLIRLLEMLKELRLSGERSLIFTQYTGTGKLLQETLEHEMKETIPFLHGGVSKRERDRMVQRFQDESLPDEERPRMFILSLKAGGTGLNLTAANHVFHYDRWWNPAVEIQASDRAYRIGQTRDVQVHKLIALGTLEERIDDRIEQKQALNEQLIGHGEKWITELSSTELRELFALRCYESKSLEG